MADVDFTIGLRDLGVTRGFDRVDRSINRSRKSLGLFRQGLRGLGRGLGFSAVIGLQRAFQGLGNIVQESIGKFIRSERGLNEANRIMELSADKVKGLRVSLDELEIATAQPFDKLTAGLEALSSLQFKPARAFDILVTAARTASAEFGNVRDSADAIGVAVKKFGVTRGLAADIISQTVISGGFVTGRGLQDVTLFLSKTANRFEIIGSTLQEAGAVIANLTQAKLPARLAITQTGRFLSEISTKKFRDRLIAALDLRGIKAKDRDVDVRNIRLAGLVDVLRKLSDRQFEDLFKRETGELAALALITKETADIQEFKTQLAAVSQRGGVESRFARREKNIDFQFGQQTAAIEVALRTLGRDLAPEIVGIREQLIRVLIENKDAIITLSNVFVKATRGFANLFSLFEKESGEGGARLTRQELAGGFIKELSKGIVEGPAVEFIPGIGPLIRLFRGLTPDSSPESPTGDVGSSLGGTSSDPEFKKNQELQLQQSEREENNNNQARQRLENAVKR